MQVCPMRNTKIPTATVGIGSMQTRRYDNNMFVFLNDNFTRASNIIKLTSGVAATRFSSGKVSLGTPTVSLE